MLREGHVRSTVKRSNGLQLERRGKERGREKVGDEMRRDVPARQQLLRRRRRWLARAACRTSALRSAPCSLQRKYVEASVPGCGQSFVPYKFYTIGGIFRSLVLCFYSM